MTYRSILKRLGVILMILAMGAGLMAAGSVPAVSAASKKYGLTVASDGTLMLEGKPFYGFGCNLYSSFQRHLENPLDEDYKTEFALMKQYNIPFARIPFSGYQASYYDTYDATPDIVLSMMDDVVAEAERQNLGIIVSLMWWDPALSAHVGEKRAAMGDVNSKTMKYAKEYVATIVKRYADRPGIWGWEIGNEYNLTADLCDPQLKNYLWPDGLPTMPITPSGFNYYSSAELQVFYREIAKEIRKYDSYRMINSGNGEMRGASRAMHRASNKMDTKTHLWQVDWTPDTLDDFYYMNAYMTPAPMDTMCFHLQHATLDSPNPAYVLEHQLWGRKVSSAEYFKEYANAAKKAKKALFFGEMGDFMDMEHAPDMPQKFKQVTEWVVQAGIQIAATWQFGDSPKKHMASDYGVEGEKLKVLSAQNLAYRSAGKQDLSKAWTDVKPQTTTTTKKPTSTTTATKAGTRPTTSKTADSSDGSDPTQPDSTEQQAEVDTYMKTSSANLSIDAQSGTIDIARPVTLDIFQRSIALRSGYTLKVFDAQGGELTEPSQTVDIGYVVAVHDPDGTELRRFTVAQMGAGDGTSTPSTSAPVSTKPKGLPVWGIVLIVLGILGALGGGGAGLYFGVIRKRKSGQGPTV